MAGKGDIVEQALKLIGDADEGAKAALRSAAVDVPTHLRAGHTVQAFPGAAPETQQLVDYLNARNPDLEYTPEARAQRRQDLGLNVSGYHGSPRDIEGFSNIYSTPEGYWGGHHYATSNPLDASVNYATPEGPDIALRLEKAAEDVLSNYHPSDVINWYEGKYGSSAGINPNNPKLIKEYSDDVARESLGITNEGAVYPVALRMKNPVKIDSPDQTFWGYDVQYDDEGDIVSEGGKAVDLINNTRQALQNYQVSPDEIDEVMGKLYDKMNDYGGIDAKSYDQIVRGSHIYAYDDNGNMVSPGHIMSDVFRSMGHDSIDMPTDVFAGGLGRAGMPHTGGDTRHYIIFDPANIRSEFGAFDPFRAKSTRLSDADGGRVEKGDGGGLRRAVLDLLGPSGRKGLSALTPPGSGYAGKIGKPSTVKLPFVGEAEAKPIPELMQSAKDYLAKRGKTGSHELAEYPTLDEAFATRVAQEYDRMKHAPSDPAVRRAYDAMAQETLDQLEAAKNAGIEFRAIRGEDPYAASPSLGYADIAERGNLYFFPTDAGFGSSIEFDPANSPLLKRVGRIGDLENATVNDAFRIVHDLYGHYGPGNPFFRAPGEERAYLLHRQMYSPEALPAMTSETRGQNSWLNYGPFGPRNRSASSENTVFADQKTGIMEPWTYLERADGGEVDDDIADALRIARADGGSVPVMVEDAKGNKYDAQGNVIPPTETGPNPGRSATPEEVGRRAAQSPETFDALMEQYAVPDRDILDYEALKAQVQKQPQAVQQMSHVGEPPRRDIKVDMPLFGGEYSLGTAPYNVAPGLATAAQTAYDLKTAPFYAFPPTAPLAAGMDVAEGVATEDPLAAGLAIGFGPGGKYAKAAGIGAASYLMAPDEAQAGPERWFSKLYRAAEALPMEKMTGEQALAMLRKVSPAEEIKWTGLEGFAADNPVTTKQNLLDYLRRNQIQTRDVTLGGSKPMRWDEVVPSETAQARYKPQWDRLVAEKRELDQKYWDAPVGRRPSIQHEINLRGFVIEQEMDDLHAQMVKDTIEEMGGLGQPTKYHDYSTPGGQNYQETLVTLGGKKRPQVMQKDRMWHIVDENGETMRNPSGGQRVYYTQGDAERAANSLYRGSGVYTSPHWNEPDVLGHFRSQILTANPPGANRPYKLFNVDEAQSDWAQAGRKKGIYDADAYKKWSASLEANKKEAQQITEALDGKVRQLESSGAFGVEPRSTFGRDFNDYHTRRQDVLASDPEVRALRKRADELINQRVELERNKPGLGGVPSAPYIANTQAWTDLSIKKALDQAIDAGADYFTFTPGEVHAERFNLSKKIEGLAYDPKTGQLDYKAKGSSPYGWESLGGYVPPEKLSDYVGKEVADKLLAQSLREDGTQRLEGLDLQTGGEGMIDYYNNIYKKRVEKVVKDATGKKVKWEVLPAETSEGIVPRLGFRIDDDVKKAAFSTFARGGVVRDSNLVNKALALTSGA